MADFSNIDFEGTNNNQNGEAPDTNKEDNRDLPITHLDGEPDGTTTALEDTTGNHKDEGNKDKNKEGDKNNDNEPSTGGLEVGSEVEVDNIVYVVAENGDLLDKDGKVFKPAAEVDNWIKSLNAFDETNANEINIETIQDALGIEITDESGKPIEFTNDVVGVKSYVDKVIELRTKEIQEATINTLYEKNPIIKNFVDYLTINDGNYEGFGEIKDRSNIVIDESNVAQQEAIIRTAYTEFGRKGSVDNYIKYLKDTNSLLDVSKEELAALQDKDKEEENARAAQAEAIRNKEIEDTAEYWSKIKKAVDSRVIAGFKLPESLILERDGKKLTATPNDFFNYLNRVDNKTKTTGYQKDLDNMTEEEIMNADILDAWLHFTGGSYKDLVKMAIKEEQVKRLVLTSKDKKTTRTVTINKPKGKNDVNDILLS